MQVSGEHGPHDGHAEDEPTWRPVDAIPDATPACERGIPDTALLVIGAFSQPCPMPNTRQHTSTYHTGEVPVRKVSSRPPAAIPVPAMSSGARVPRRAITRPASGAETAITTAIGSRNSAATSGR